MAIDPTRTCIALNADDKSRTPKRLMKRRPPDTALAISSCAPGTALGGQTEAVLREALRELIVAIICRARFAADAPERTVALEALVRIDLLHERLGGPSCSSPIPMHTAGRLFMKKLTQ